jgi:predicted nucleic acid-binding protein
MIKFVIDASALVELTIGDAPPSDLVRRFRTGTGVAPELIDVEALNVLRKLQRAGDSRVTDDSAVDVREAPITRSPHRPLLARVWALRETVSAYDATYIALAEHFGVPLLTCDARLGRAHGHDAEVIVYPRS